MRILEEMPVDTADGPCGQVADIVIDPVHGRLTHLVVKPSGRAAHLVPIDAVVSSDDRVVLSWTAEQLEAAEQVESADFLEMRSWPHLQDGWDVGIVRVLAWPYYVADDVDLGPVDAAGGPTGELRSTTEFDRIPRGAAEIRRESPVTSSDGEVVGHVDGLLVDADRRVTHLVLQRGHLWGRREVTIPVDDVDKVETDAVRLRVTREAVGAFPSVRFHRHHA